ncbi:MAG: hypothetical protein IKD89_03245 [Clostridia bacterium]|nr:hypothetical protein [Clostridia bacterium]
MTHYELMFKRRSVRHFRPEPLDEATLAEVRKAIKRLRPLFRNVRTRITLVDDIGIEPMFDVMPPHFIIFTSTKKETHNMNAGYMLEQLSLELAGMGIGSCFVEAQRPTKEIIDGVCVPNGEYIIMLAIGRPNMTLLRDSTVKFDRMPKEQFLRKGEYTEAIEACRLAPSGHNSQPWCMINEGEKLHIYSKKLADKSHPIHQTLDSIDIGILLYHVVVSAREAGLDGIQEFTLEGSKQAPEGFYYITSII